MISKNPYLSKLITTFDCEITQVSNYEPLSTDEMMKLVTGLPDNNSFTSKEISVMLGISLTQVDELIEAASGVFCTAIREILQNERCIVLAHVILLLSALIAPISG